MKRLVLCELNESYLERIKKQMRERKLPVPKSDIGITVSHVPLYEINQKDLCDCKVCMKIKANL